MLLVVSANVGYLGVGDVLVSRVAHIERLVEARQPLFVALHFQEVGGDNRDPAAIAGLRDALSASPVLADFVSTGLLCNTDIDHDFSALGSAYFVRRSEAALVQVLDRRLDEMVPLSAMQNEAEEARYLSFSKTEQLAGSRKGYLLVSFSISGHRLELMNIHLPADVDNVVAASAVPSEYATTRAELLSVCLSKCAIGENTKAVMAGDFNFRLDLKPLWESKQAVVTDRLEPKTLRLGFVDEAIRKKTAPVELQPWDRELERFNASDRHVALLEHSRKFLPSYCLRADESYDTKRCPGWPDRVLVTPATKAVMTSVSYESQSWQCDHHLVFLSFSLASAASAKQRMRHEPDEELASIGHLSDAGKEPRRRRGPSMLFSLAPTVAAVAAIAAIGIFFYRRV